MCSMNLHNNVEVSTLSPSLSLLLKKEVKKYSFSFLIKQILSSRVSRGFERGVCVTSQRADSLIQHKLAEKSHNEREQIDWTFLFSWV